MRLIKIKWTEAICMFCLQVALFSSNAVCFASSANIHLAPRAQTDAVSALNIFLSPDPMEYLQAEKAIRHFAREFPENTIQVAFFPKNGRSLVLRIPNPETVSLPENLMQAICQKYLAQVYARALVLGNPGDLIQVGVVPTSANAPLSDSLAALDVTLRAEIQKCFDNLGGPLFNKANGGKPIQIESLNTLQQDWARSGARTTPPQGVSSAYLDTLAKELDRSGEKIVAIGIDIGATSMKTTLTVNGRDVTEKVLGTNSPLLSRASFEKAEGGTGREFRERVVLYASQLKAKVEEAYGKVDALFIGLPGAPDLEKGRMNSLGGLSRGFPDSRQSPEEFQTHLDEANGFIGELSALMKKSGGLFGFNNDMIPWAEALSEFSGYRDGVMLITGGGIGVLMMEDGREVYGANEGGHQIFMIDGDRDPGNSDSVAGSFEIYGGSVPGILRAAAKTGLLEAISIQFGVSPENVTPKDVGQIAAGIAPWKHASSQLGTMPQKAMQTWEDIERIEAQHLIFLHLLTGKTQFAFGGGTTAGRTGTIRKNFLDHYLNQYSRELGLTVRLETVLADVKASHGAALRANKMALRNIALQRTELLAASSESLFSA